MPFRLRAHVDFRSTLAGRFRCERQTALGPGGRSVDARAGSDAGRSGAGGAAEAGAFEGFAEGVGLALDLEDGVGGVGGPAALALGEPAAEGLDDGEGGAKGAVAGAELAHEPVVGPGLFAPVAAAQVGAVRMGGDEVRLHAQRMPADGATTLGR